MSATPELECLPEQRYRWARFKHRLPGGALEFELEKKEFSSNTAIVPGEDLPNDMSAGYRHEIFLVRLTGAGNNWLSRGWARPANPWLNDRLPSVGDEMRGVVVRFVSDWLAIVRVAVGDTDIEVDLSRKDLPQNQFKDISATLRVGDRIVGCVEEVDFPLLRCRLSVNGWLRPTRDAAKAQNALYRRQRDDQRDRAKPEMGSNRHNALADYRILLVDDDPRLRRALGRWLSILGAEVQEVSDANGVDRVLGGFKPTHAFLDFGLKGVGQFEATAQLLSSAAVPTAVFTGDADKAHRSALRFGFGLIAKPATIAELSAWLANPSPVPSKRRPSAPERKKSGRWTVDVRTDQVIAEAATLLNALCARHGLAAAFWAVAERENVFEVRARSSSLSPELMASHVQHLPRSVVSAVLHEGALKYGLLPPSDPLRGMCDELRIDRAHYIALAIISPPRPDRLIVFLKEGPIDVSLAQRIEDRRDHYELLIRAILQAEHVDQVEAFATQGRSIAASAHEARQRLAVTFIALEEAIDAARGGDTESSLVALKTLEENLTEARIILGESLTVIRAERRMLTNVEQVVQRIVKSMRRVAVDLHEHEWLCVYLNTNVTGLVSSISPAPLEQALINLIDNAIGLLPKEEWAQISVNVSIDETDLKRPVHIDIIDNGDGLTADQWSRLFEPRGTSRGKLGNGLGLYASKAMLEAAQGELELISTARWGGAHFQIRLPVVLDAMTDEKN